MKSSLLIVLAVGFAGFGALEVAALGPGTAKADPPVHAEPADSESAPAERTDDEAPPASSDAAPKLVNASYTPSNNTVEPATCLTPDLVAAFEPRHRALTERETKLDLRQAELMDLETQIQSRLDDMAATRERLQTMTERIDVAAGEDISHLVEMYSTMKPKKAAAIFDRMDPGFAAGFLREIDSARAGVIMAEMGEDQSYKVSLLIANRHAEWRNGK